MKNFYMKRNNYIRALIVLAACSYGVSYNSLNAYVQIVSVSDSVVADYAQEGNIVPTKAEAEDFIIKFFDSSKNDTHFVDGLIVNLAQFDDGFEQLKDSMPDASVIVDMIFDNISLYPESLQNLFCALGSDACARIINETYVIDEFDNLVSVKIRRPLLAWPKFVDRIIDLTKSMPEAQAIADALNGMRNSMAMTVATKIRNAPSHYFTRKIIEKINNLGFWSLKKRVFFSEQDRPKN